MKRSHQQFLQQEGGLRVLDDPGGRDGFVLADLPTEEQAGAGQERELWLRDLKPGEDSVHHADGQTGDVRLGLLLVADLDQPGRQVVSV